MGNAIPGGDSTHNATSQNLKPTQRYRFSKLNKQYKDSNLNIHGAQPKLEFKSKRLPNGRTTEYVFRQGIKYCETAYSAKSISMKKAKQRKFKCAERDCPAFIKTTNNDPFQYEYCSQHSSKAHPQYKENDLRIFDFKEHVKQRVRDENLAPHDAYHSVAREQPDIAEQVHGYESIRNVAWNERYVSHGKLPKHKKDWSKYLAESGIDGNYYDQLLKTGNYNKSEINPDTIKQWEDRRGAFCIGDGGTGGRYQFICPESGARALAECQTIYVDCSYKFTPRQSPNAVHTRPYGAGCHLLSGFKNENNEFVPCTVPCATILFGPEHPDTDEYYGGFKLLREICKRKYGVDIVNVAHVIETMGDMECPLRNAVQRLWKNSKLKICGFHYSQRLNVNIGQKHLNSYFRKDGKHYDAKVYAHLRCYHSMALAPPNLVPRCWNVLKKERKKIYLNCKEEINAFMQYHKQYYMKNGSWIVSWNHYRSYVRTNNALECKNGIVNARLGPHPFLDKWIVKLAEWYNDEYIKYHQYVNNSVQTKRHKREILKNRLLTKCWDFVDRNQDDESLLIFMKYASIALKGNQEVIGNILKRKCFYKRE